MSTKNHRSGGIYCGSHTTVIPFAGEVCDIISKIGFISKIQLGIIKPGIGTSRQGAFVKITSGGSSITLGVRGNNSFQDIHIFTGEHQETKLEIAKRLRSNKIIIRFAKNS